MAVDPASKHEQEVLQGDGSMGGASVKTGSERNMDPPRPLERPRGRPHIRSCRCKAFPGEGLESMEETAVRVFAQDDDEKAGLDNQHPWEAGTEDPQPAPIRVSARLALLEPEPVGGLWEFLRGCCGRRQT